MRVLFVVGGFPDGLNSSHGIFSQRAAIALAQKVGLTVLHYRMLKPGRKRIEQTTENGYKLTRIAIPQIPFFNKYTMCINAYLLQLFIKPYIKEFDVVHSVSGLTGIAIGKLKNKYNFKHICQIIGDDINYILPQLKTIGCAKDLKGIDHITCNSNSLKNRVMEVYNPNIEMTPIYRGVILDDYINIKKKNKEEVVFLFLGGLADYKHSEYGDDLKGAITLMKAWSNVDNSFTKETSVKLLFGGPFTRDNIKFESWFDKLKFKGKVELIGEVKPVNITEYYAKSNITVIPSQTEGFPNVGMESFAAGNSVIGSRVGGLPELIDENENGFIFDQGDYNALSDIMLNYINNPKLIELGEKAKRKAIEKFNNADFAKNYIRVYEN